MFLLSSAVGFPLFFYKPIFKVLIALVAGLRIPLHFYNHELSCYLAQALNIVFVVQPEFKEFLQAKSGCFDPGSLLSTLSLIVNCWCHGPSQAGTMHSHFLALREILDDKEPWFINSRQSMVNPGTYLETAQCSASMTYEFLMACLREELHHLDGLGGPRCPCICCSVTSFYNLEVTCPACDAQLVPIPCSSYSVDAFAEGMLAMFLGFVL